MAKRSERARLLQGLDAMISPPVGVSARQWRGVKTLLIAIAKHYPKPYPSQATLAKETGYSRRAIQGYQAKAVEVGLLLVKADAGKKGIHNSWSKTNRYLIQLPDIDDKLAPMDGARCAHKPYGLRPTGMSDSHSSSMSDESSELAALVRALRWNSDEPGREEESRQVGNSNDRRGFQRREKRPVVKQAEDYTPKESNYQAIKPPSDPPRWKFCAEYFFQQWNEMVVKTERNDPLRQVRPDDSYGHCQNYLNAHFFGRTASSPKTISQVQVLIDEFIDNAYRGRVRFKPGQSAWMVFTGAWGRGKVTANSTTASNAAYVPPQHRGK